MTHSVSTPFLDIRNMKHILIAITLILSALTTTHAQKHEDTARHRQWMQEMTQAKAEFVAKDLKLSDEQSAKFIQLYKSMCAETGKLAAETRRLEKEVSNKSNASDVEYEKAAEAVYEFRGKENAIEMRYFNQFKSILSKQQLFKIKSAERKWNKELMKQHRHNKRQKGAK